MTRALSVITAAAACVAALSPQRAHAYAEFEIIVGDPDGQGFSDPTPVDPVGGNEGTTLGEQRLNALRRATELWGQVLDSDVVIRVEARFTPIDCVGGVSTTLAFGGTTYVDYVLDDEGGELLYPTALADRVLEEDQHPGEPDITIEFNSNLDSGTCLTGMYWYYGLDGEPGGDSDMIDTALHELGHGLGMQPMYTTATGELIAGVPSAFTTRVLDLDTGKHWDEMTAPERLASQVNAWRVVWDGPEATRAAEALLAGGRPSVQSPQVADLSGFAADAAYGAWTVATSVSGELAADTAGLCPPEDVDGKVALMTWECAHSTWALSVEADGAIGILVEVPTDWELPVSPLDEPMPVAVGIPVVAISSADLQRFIDAALAGTVTVELSIDEDAILGADEGRPMLNVTSPLSASSLAHFEPLARPNLLMEPLAGPRTLHDLDITPAFMRDLGWTPFCGNGEINQEEECDEGEDNSDTEPDACRTSCLAAGCGDGVTDEGEACDDGEDNSDDEPNACRTSCEEAACGDGVTDDGEACDEGEDNSDDEPNACRTSCEEAACGDGTTDMGEACDDGASNSDTAADACRADCEEAACGDGVLDTGEACDDGASNSDTAADACRADCVEPSCGDGVVDTGEVCDPGTGMPCNSDCSSEDPNSAPRGDGGVDGTDGGAEGSGGDEGGCGCRIAGRRASHAGQLAGLLMLLSALALRRRDRARG